MTDFDDDAPAEIPLSNAVREAMLEMITDRLRDAGMDDDEVEYEFHRRAKHTEYDLGLELCGMMRHEPIVIPAGLVGRPCRSCKTTVFWIPFKNTPYKHSISIAGAECIAPTGEWDGLGFAHVADCPTSGLRLKEFGTIGLAGRRAGSASAVSHPAQVRLEQPDVPSRKSA